MCLYVVQSMISDSVWSCPLRSNKPWALRCESGECHPSVCLGGTWHPGWASSGSPQEKVNWEQWLGSKLLHCTWWYHVETIWKRRVLVAIRCLAEYRLLPFSRTDTFGHFWTPWALGALQHPAYMSFASQVISQWIKRCYSIGAFDSLAAILCSGKAGWARRPGSVQEVSFLRLGLSIPSMKT